MTLETTVVMQSSTNEPKVSSIELSTRRGGETNHHTEFIWNLLSPLKRRPHTPCAGILLVQIGEKEEKAPTKSCYTAVAGGVGNYSPSPCSFALNYFSARKDVVI